MGCLLCLYISWCACLICVYIWNNRQNWSPSFTCNCSFGLWKTTHICMLLQKSCFENFSKFQQLWWTLFPETDRFYNCWMCIEKELCRDCFFYIATLISLKLEIFLVPGINISIHVSGEIFLFINPEGAAGENSKR